MAQNAIARRKQNMDHLKKALTIDSVKTQFDNALKENAGAFVASIIDLVGSDTGLQECDPTAVIMECMTAATLKLPINKQLGFAYVMPFKKVPTFVMGYKGYIQLAMRSGQYKYLNTDCLLEGMEVEADYLTGAIKITGETKKNAQVIGYFCHLELINGFTKSLFMTKQEVVAYAKEYCPSYKSSKSAWKTNFDDMALKTTVRRLLSKWGIMSTEMEKALKVDVDDKVAAEINANANGKVIDITPAEEVDDDKEKKELDPEGKKKQSDANLEAEVKAKHEAEAKEAAGKNRGF